MLQVVRSPRLYFFAIELLRQCSPRAVVRSVTSAVPALSRPAATEQEQEASAADLEEAKLRRAT